MARRDSKNIIRLRVHKRIRSRVSGTEQRPRLAVFRSVKHIYAQVIDDSKGHTVVAASSNEKDLKNGGNVAGAKEIGKLVAERAKDKGITAASRRWPKRPARPDWTFKKWECKSASTRPT